MTTLGRILIVEDDPNDVELTLTALADYNLANEVVVTRDGQQALDYLYCRGEFHRRSNENSRCHAARSKTAEGRWVGGLAADQVRRAPEDDARGGADVIPRGKRHDEKLQPRGERLCRKAGRFSRVRQCGEGTRRLLGGHQRAAAG